MQKEKCSSCCCWLWCRRGTQSQGAQEPRGLEKSVEQTFPSCLQKALSLPELILAQWDSLWVLTAETQVSHVPRCFRPSTKEQLLEEIVRRNRDACSRNSTLEGLSDSRVGKVLSLHADSLGFITSIPYDPWALPGLIPENRASTNPEHCSEWPQK